MFAVVAGVLGDTARKHPHAAFPKPLHAVLFGGGIGQNTGQFQHAAGRYLGGGEHVEQQGDAVERLLQAFE